MRYRHRWNHLWAKLVAIVVAAGEREPYEETYDSQAVDVKESLIGRPLIETTVPHTSHITFRFSTSYWGFSSGRFHSRKELTGISFATWIAILGQGSVWFVGIGVPIYANASCGGTLCITFEEEKLVYKILNENVMPQSLNSPCSFTPTSEEYCSTVLLATAHQPLLPWLRDSSRGTFRLPCWSAE